MHNSGLKTVFPFFVRASQVMKHPARFALQVIKAFRANQGLLLAGISGFLLYVVGVMLEILLITSIYLVMPFGRKSILHALIGGATAGVLWVAIRHSLVWYFGTLSQVSVVYGSLTSAIVVLLSFEIGATLLLLGAQVIAEYERLEKGGG